MFQGKRRAQQKLKIQNTHKQVGQTKESERKEIGTGLVVFSKREKQKGVASSEGNLVFTLKKFLS